jgi:hypothetical protein
MNTTTIETKDIPEGNGCPRWVLHTAITADSVSWHGLDDLMVCCCHLHHGDNVNETNVFLGLALMPVITAKTTGQCVVSYSSSPFEAVVNCEERHK